MQTLKKTQPGESSTSTSSTQKTTNQITEGVIWEQLLLFFFPILMGTFFQQLYNTADAMMSEKRLCQPSADLPVC